MIRILFFHFLFFTISISSFSQKVAISVNWPASTFAYVGADNDLTCTVEGIPCKSVLLSTSNGTITKQSCNYYNYKPNYPSDSKIIVSKKRGKKIQKIGEFYLRVRNLPEPVAIVGGLYGGSISKGALRAQTGLGSSPPQYVTIDVKYSVRSYNVSIVRNKELVFFKNCEGNTFTNEIYTAFKDLQKDDVVLFSSIMVLLPDESQTLAKPIELKIE